MGKILEEHKVQLAGTESENGGGSIPKHACKIMSSDTAGPGGTIETFDGTCWGGGGNGGGHYSFKYHDVEGNINSVLDENGVVDGEFKSTRDSGRYRLVHSSGECGRVGSWISADG